jgi:hypothetical protein
MASTPIAAALSSERPQPSISNRACQHTAVYTICAFEGDFDNSGLSGAICTGGSSLLFEGDKNSKEMAYLVPDAGVPYQTFSRDART